MISSLFIFRNVYIKTQRNILPHTEGTEHMGKEDKMTKIKKGDFVELEYTGKLEDGAVFDTTNEKTAKENGLYNEKAVYGPVIICMGQHHVLKGLDDAIEGKEPGQTFTAEIRPEDGFGKKNAKLLKMIPGNIFRRDGIEPVKGMPVNIDNNYGTIISVSGGRIIVDFNHPLASKKLIYDVKLDKIVEKDEDKIRALVKLKIGDDIKVKYDDATKTAVVEIEKLPKEIQEIMKKGFMEIIPSLKDIKFEKEKKEDKVEEKKDEKKEDKPKTEKPKEAKPEVKKR